MLKVDIEKFVKIFSSLDPKDKLQIADAIVEELHLSDSLIREDGYDRDLSGMVMPILENYITNETNKEKLKNTKQLLDRFNKLPDSNKANIIEGLEEEFNLALIKEESFVGYQTCQKEGHIWNNNICTRCGKEKIKTNN